MTLLRCLPYLRDAGVMVDVVCSGPPSELDHAFERLGSKIHRLRRGANPAITAHDVRRFLRTHRYDVVHSRFGYTSGGIAWGADRAGVPAIVSLHSTVPSLYRMATQPLLRRLHRIWLAWHRRRIDRHACVVVGHSSSNLDAFEPRWRARPDRYRCIHNGIDLPSTLPSRSEARRQLECSSSTTIVLHVGTLRPEKDHETLLEIFDRVRVSRPDVRLWLVGDGACRTAIEAGIARRGLAQKCRLWGTQTDPWPFYRAADVFVFPSRIEGFGNAVIEAQLSELPVAASAIPSHRESVAPTYHALLFAPGDAGAGADAVDHLLTLRDRDEGAQSVAAARAFASTFTVERMARRLVELYAEVSRS